MQTNVNDAHGHGHHEDDSISEQLNALALEKLSLFAQSHDSGDLDEAISFFRDASVPLSDDDPARPRFLANLAYALDKRSRKTDDMDQLDEAISLLRETSNFRQPGDDGYISHLDFFAQAIGRRYDHFGRIEDLAERIALYRRILEHCPVDDLDRPAYINNLASALSAHFKKTDHAEDLEEAIALYRESLAHMPTNHPFRPVALHNLSQTVMSRFDGTLQRDDLDEAIALGRTSITLAPSSHPLRRAFIASTIEALTRRFELFDLKQDLDEEISIRQDYLSPDHPEYIQSLAGLIFRLNVRFERYGRTEDVNQMIEYFWLTFASLPPSQPTPHIGCLVALASELERRFNLLHLQEDLDDAITVSYDALTLCPEGHPLGAHTHILGSLIRFLRWRFQDSNDREDLEELIRLGRMAITIFSLEPMESFMFTNDLALDLSSHYDLLKRQEDLDESIALHRRAHDICPSNYSERSKVLLALGIRIMTRYEVLGRTQDLQESISFHLETLASARLPKDQAVHATSIDNLCSGGISLLKRLSDAETFDDAVNLYSKALEELSCFSFDRPSEPTRHRIHLPSTAGALMGCLLEHARMEHINETCGKLCQTLALSIPNLGAFESPTIALAIRFLNRSNDDLDMAVELHRTALTLFPSGHDHHPLCLSNLATSLMLRFDQINNIEDLNEAADLYRKSLNNSLPSCLYYYEVALSFVWCLLIRFGCIGDYANLIEAMTIHRETLLYRGAREVTYVPSKTSEDFSASAQYRFGRLVSTKTFEEAAEVCCEAVILAPPEHPDRPRAQGGAEQRFNTGVKTLEELLSWSKNLQENAEESLFILSAYLSSGVKGPVVSDEFLFILARLYIVQHDLDLAFSIYADSIQAGSINQCFRAALTWARLAREHHHSSVSQAYSQALLLSERRIAMRPTVESQYKLFTSDAVKVLSSHAASYMTQEGDLEAAVEMLERGRGQLWSKLRTYRHAFDQSPIENDPSSLGEFSTNQEIADFEVLSENDMINSSDLFDDKEFKQQSREFYTGISSQLEDITTSTLDETFGPISISNVNARFERDSAPHRQLLNTWEHLTGEMRGKPSISGFLSPASFSSLRGAAVDGPVIIVSLSSYRSDALIVRNAGSPILVPLDKDLPEVVSELCTKLFKIKNVRLDIAKSRKMFPVYPIQEDMTTILRILWQKICAPVVVELEKIQVKKQSRIWWCPTGALIQLPLHAAGPYTPGEENLYDLFISSYTPTLSSLIQARKSMAPESSTSSTRLLAIGQSDSLPQVSKELHNLEEMFSTNIGVYDNSEATPDCVLSQLKQYKWIHFACHGGLNAARPFESYFKLHGGNLTLRQILRSNLPSAEFGFLAACYTMGGDVEGNPDEGLSLAAAIQFSGFRSVVGTLWAMSDSDGPALARDFYGYMLRNGIQNIKSSDAAIGLHRATEAMRNAGVPVERWSTFVHVGV